MDSITPIIGTPRVMAGTLRFAHPTECRTSFVMPGLVPGIYVFTVRATQKDVDGRDKPGHDEEIS
jgi:hypothetical protein